MNELPGLEPGKRTRWLARRPRPQVMRLTEAAASRIKDILAQADKPIAGVRVGVKNGGCAGMSYTMEYADSAKPTTRWSRTRACSC